MEFKSKHIDLQSIRRVNNLEFREEDQNFLVSLFKQTNNKSFKDYYFEMVSNAAILNKNTKDSIPEKNERFKGKKGSDTDGDPSSNPSGKQTAQGK